VICEHHLDRAKIEAIVVAEATPDAS